MATNSNRHSGEEEEDMKGVKHINTKVQLRCC